MTDLEHLAAETTAMVDFFYVEQCHYTRPLITLRAIFGEENCHFSASAGLAMLSLHPCGLGFSVRLNAGGSIDDTVRDNLAQCALQSLPPRRVAELVHRSLLLKDRSLAASPIAVTLSLTSSNPLRASGTKKRSRNTGAQSMASTTSDAMMEQLASMNRCTIADIDYQFKRQDVQGNAFIKCTVTTPAGTWEPYVLCKTSASALQHALLGTICCSALGSV